MRGGRFFERYEIVRELRLQIEAELGPQIAQAIASCPDPGPAA